MKKSLIKDYLKKAEGKTLDFSNKNNVIQPIYGYEPKHVGNKSRLLAGLLAGTIILGSTTAMFRSCNNNEKDVKLPAQAESAKER